MKGFLKKNKGLTLIETMTAIVIFTITIGGLMSIIFYLYKTHGYVFQQAMAVTEARKGVSIMVKELREAKTGEDGSYVIEKAEPSEIVFYSDIDKDGEIERVRYYLQGTNLMKEIINPEGLPAQYSSVPEERFLSRYIGETSPPIFTYLGEDGEILGISIRKKDTKMVEIYLQVEVPNGRFSVKYVLESTVKFRNL